MVTVFDLQEKGFLIEAVSINKPEERAYMTVKSLGGFRGKVLTQYIDKALEIVGLEDSDNEGVMVDEASKIQGLDLTITPETFL